MKDEFIYCPKCGTRNFSDDKVCGICKTKLNKTDKISPNQPTLMQKPKNNYFILVFVFGGLFLLYYQVFFKKDSIGYSESQTLSNIKTSLPEYLIVEEQLNNKRAFNVSVRISTKITDDQLRAIALQVKNSIHAISENGVIFFLLPEMKKDNGAWAAVDFKPDMKVRIIGKSIEDERKIISNLDKITDYLGLWIDNGMPGDVVLRIRIDKVDGYVYEYVSSVDPKPSDLATRLVKTKIKGRTVFNFDDDSEQFFLLEENGNLSSYDNYGYIETYIKVR